MAHSLLYIRRGQPITPPDIGHTSPSKERLGAPFFMPFFNPPDSPLSYPALSLARHNKDPTISRNVKHLTTSANHVIHTLSIELRRSSLTVSLKAINRRNSFKAASPPAMQLFFRLFFTIFLTVLTLSLKSFSSAPVLIIVMQLSGNRQFTLGLFNQ